MITRRPSRLKGVSYVGYQRYFLTAVTDGRQRAFEDEHTALQSIEQLRHSASRHDFALVAYCFMPDHLHTLTYGTSLSGDFRGFVDHFKKTTGFMFARRHGRRLWQPGFYERILRDDEATESVARYTLENPIRPGLVTRVWEYPYAGSDLYDLRGMLTAWER